MKAFNDLADFSTEEIKALVELAGDLIKQPITILAAIVVLAKSEDISGTESLVYKFSDGDNQSQVVSGPSDINLEASRATYVDDTKQFILKADGTVRFEQVGESIFDRAEVDEIVSATSMRD